MMIARTRRDKAGHCDYRSLSAETALRGTARPAAGAATARACDPQREVRDQPQRPRDWRDIERAMNRARDLRSRHCAALFAAGLRRLWKLIDARRVFASVRAKAAVCALMLAGPVALGFALASRAALAQEKFAVATGPSGSDAATDRARLAELGIGLTAIEQCEDVALLWRAVRELVLPQRVSEPIQQRILRRVWVLDPDIAKGSLHESEFN